MPFPPRRPEHPPLNTYGLPSLGYEGLDTGNYLQDQLHIEAMCFRIGLRPDEGGLGKFGHFKNYVDLLWNNPDTGSSKRFVWNSWSDKMLEKACECDELCIAGCASSGKSGPFALWAVANYCIDPTHTKVLVMSTSIKGAKNRIWKDVKEFWGAVAGLPGKLLDATNEIRGLTYQGTGYGMSSGIELMATEKSSEASALEKLIGIKAPKTGEPDGSFESLLKNSEFIDLKDQHCEEYLRELLPRLINLAQDRVGKLIVIVDEATGCAPGVLNAIMANMKPGNFGHFQVIFLGNPASHFDSFGMFAEPAAGWNSVSINDDEWETKSGGICVRFDASRNPRIVDKNEKLWWMPTEDAIRTVADRYGEESLFYYRMVRGFWFPLGMESGVYSEADFISGGSMSTTTWGLRTPRKLAALDPGFTTGGDRSSCTFASFGIDHSGLQTLQRDEVITIKADPNIKTVPVPTQIVRNWKRECLKRGIQPEDACFDATGGGVSFAAIVHAEWSPRVNPISSGGKASKDPLGNEKGPDGKKITAAERYANKATEIWYGAHEFLRTGQLRGVTPELAKEVCSRQHDKENQSDGRVLKIEGKRKFKSREKHSPDDSDSWFLTIEHAKRKLGFRASGVSVMPGVENRDPRETSWNHFKEKARKLFGKKR